MSYNIGDFRAVVQLLRYVSDGKDKYGREMHHYEPQEPWLPALAKDVSGRDFYAAAAQQMEDIVTIVMRYGHDIKPLDRFRFVDTWEMIPVDTEYKIVSVNHLGYRGDFIQYRLRAVTAQAVTTDG